MIAVDFLDIASDLLNMCSFLRFTFACSVWLREDDEYEPRRFVSIRRGVVAIGFGRFFTRTTSVTNSPCSYHAELASLP